MSAAGARPLQVGLKGGFAQALRQEGIRQCPLWPTPGIGAQGPRRLVHLCSLRRTSNTGGVLKPPVCFSKRDLALGHGCFNWQT